MIYYFERDNMFTNHNISFIFLPLRMDWETEQRLDCGKGRSVRESLSWDGKWGGNMVSSLSGSGWEIRGLLEEEENESKKEDCCFLWKEEPDLRDRLRGMKLTEGGVIPVIKSIDRLNKIKIISTFVILREFNKKKEQEIDIFILFLPVALWPWRRDISEIVIWTITRQRRGGIRICSASPTISIVFIVRTSKICLIFLVICQKRMVSVV